MMIGTPLSRASASCLEAGVDLLDDSLPVIELVNRVLQLVIEDQPVGNHDHAVKDPLVLLVVQRRQPVRQPADSCLLFPLPAECSIK